MLGEAIIQKGCFDVIPFFDDEGRGIGVNLTIDRPKKMELAIIEPHLISEDHRKLPVKLLCCS